MTAKLCFVHSLGFILSSILVVEVTMNMTDYAISRQSAVGGRCIKIEGQEDRKTPKQKKV